MKARKRSDAQEQAYAMKSFTEELKVHEPCCEERRWRPKPTYQTHKTFLRPFGSRLLRLPQQSVSNWDVKLGTFHLLKYIFTHCFRGIREHPSKNYRLFLAFMNQILPIWIIKERDERHLPEHPQPCPMALDGIPSTLLQFPVLHGTCQPLLLRVS